ncbi:putative receptor-like protein kinase [Trifolium medium]|nr:putative receptor-like protein kinase [Trifolium medium]
MSEVVEALKPLPNLKDMASSSYYFQTMQADRFSASPNTRNGRTQGGSARNGPQQRSLSISHGTHASPFRHRYPQHSPKPTGKAQS